MFVPIFRWKLSGEELDPTTSERASLGWKRRGLNPTRGSDTAG